MEPCDLRGSEAAAGGRDPAPGHGWPTVELWGLSQGAPAPGGFLLWRAALRMHLRS